ncbi:hypothetical protein [Candidatus Phycosocius spiralis]|uniref:Lipoprotein n=1 Tax=Candidatus Phycosocius spiralis TaxID=2815099 RepID=A0ABQ4PYJ3_9PROT|nr:hypothetical protein [Candidatus Phycosocius spiralis]GIU68144.1 hypothetical protein PsB1_2298 [Candidatus Phycosocius spiralis]
MKAWSYWALYQRDNFVVIPEQIMFPNGLLSSVAPYLKIDLDDPQIADQFRSILSSDNVQKVKNYDDANNETSTKILSNLLKVKSQKQLAREVKLLSVERNSGRFNVELTVGQKNGSFLGDPELSASIPKAMSLEQTVDFLIDHFKQQSAT